MNTSKRYILLWLAVLALLFVAVVPAPPLRAADTVIQLSNVPAADPYNGFPDQVRITALGETLFYSAELSAYTSASQLYTTTVMPGTERLLGEVTGRIYGLKQNATTIFFMIRTSVVSPQGKYTLCKLLPDQSVDCFFPVPTSKYEGVSAPVLLNERVYMLAGGGFSEWRLYESDGTAEGTKEIARKPGTDPHDNDAHSLTLVGQKLFFAAPSLQAGNELWISDGSAAGTKMLVDIRPGPESSMPYWLFDVNGQLYFAADDGTHGMELWTSDGTPAGTRLVADINPGAASSIDTSYTTPPFTSIGNLLYFVANDGVHGAELWKSDGTAAGTQLVADIRPGLENAEIKDPVAVGDTLFLSANDGYVGQELWRTGGSLATTALVADINRGSGSSQPKAISAVGNHVFFGADDGISGVEPWRSDGTPSGTKRVRDMAAGSASSNPESFVAFQQHVVFAATTPASGTQVWASPLDDASDAYVAAPAMLGIAPDKVGSLSVAYGNSTQVPPEGTTLRLTLDPALEYLGDTSGISAIVKDNIVEWPLPALQAGQPEWMAIHVRAPDVAVGMDYPVKIELIPAASESDLTDNAANTIVFTAQQVFVPISSR